MLGIDAININHLLISAIMISNVPGVCGSGYFLHEWPFKTHSTLYNIVAMFIGIGIVTLLLTPPQLKYIFHGG